ncbi:MAG: right-handed parallel beta-helix repeat-containing protein [Rikenellaceae bacterium]
MKKTKLLFTALLTITLFSMQARNIHVSPSGSDMNNGSKEAPFKTISQAAYVALGGDSVIIHAGTYRERVSPANAGINRALPITYVAAPGEEVFLKGSDAITGWKKVSGNVWSVVIPNTYFGDFNPYKITLVGDWLHNGKNRHLGEVYIDGKALNEDPKMEDAKNLEANRWHSTVDDENTTIYANFDGAAPSKSLIEINVRSTCFFPKTNGVDYITVDGLNISQAATQWAPPTGEQVGIVGPNWSKGWIIKNCDISYSKCVGVSIGKERSSGQNLTTLYGKQSKFNKSGFSREIEAIISAINRGWSRETVGSHLIENNTIYECGQAGIVGHLGCIFSVIRNNEIRDINYTEDITGFETGGIKLHAAIDVIIEGNIIVNTRRGIWLDWQAQGVHVRNNVFDKSISEDFFIEVSHGPSLIYNNIMLSEIGIFADGQGLLFANNLIRGKVNVRASQYRYTPYHMPHSTALRGFFNNSGGDARYFNNIFLALQREEDGSIKNNGLVGYEGYPAEVDTAKKGVSTEGTLHFKFPVYTFGNVYYKGGEPFEAEEGQNMLDIAAEDVQLIKNEDGSYSLSSTLNLAQFKDAKSIGVNTQMLGQTFISEQIFENVDFTPFVLDVDFYGRERNADNPVPGPFEIEQLNYIWR